ncbi:MAG: hypothetical protein ACI9A1_001839 [Lentimonas sp.]|jgi:hypothetical protein
MRPSLGVTLTEEYKTGWKQEGQTNPFYCAMVEQFDYYLGTPYLISRGSTLPFLSS